MTTKLTEKEREELLHEGIFCDINECPTQKIYFDELYSDIPKTERTPIECTCGGEKRREDILNEFESLLAKKVEEALQVACGERGHNWSCWTAYIGGYKNRVCAFCGIVEDWQEYLS